MILGVVMTVDIWWLYIDVVCNRCWQWSQCSGNQPAMMGLGF